MKVTAKQIAQLINGKIEGDENVAVSKLAKIEEGEKSDISFIADAKYNSYIYSTQSGIVVIKDNFILEHSVDCTLIRVKDPRFAFVKLLQFYDSLKSEKLGISKHAFIAKSATIGRNVYIGEGVVVGENAKIYDDAKIYPQVYVGDNVIIGESTIVYAGVKIYEGCQIGDFCILHSGCVIGADGFGFFPSENGLYEKIPQLGNVIIENNVEIGANSCVDRATLGSTVIHQGVKIDNLIQIAHNCTIGENTLMAACCGIAGSVSIGKNCIFAGQVGVKDHVVIGDGVMVGAQCGIHKNVADKQTLLGSPAMDAKKMMRVFAAMNFLPDLIDKMNKKNKK
ncbi:MAG: UDP-3-O-(3-hydroxymyristoyl)glucosamine N-acyltransferase [Bacteroidales bacterium]|jgi:UDP-3-O-[3-hydroxymyristoyl] glucosamine N-acyltransferase|nr:UDP-3-O-(3-hydroxymyristoyl)glucosamine N-acyltransferase [Bacteroidales bacterium]